MEVKNTHVEEMYKCTNVHTHTHLQIRLTVYPPMIYLSSVSPSAKCHHHHLPALKSEGHTDGTNLSSMPRCSCSSFLSTLETLFSNTGSPGSLYVSTLINALLT